MKTLYPFLSVLALCLSLHLAGQTVPKGFNYQTIIRDVANNQPLTNAAVALSFNLREGSPDGPVIYQELRETMTDGFGLIDHVIGTGVVQLGDFASIDWSSADKYLEIAVEVNGNFESLGIIQLWSVPYALFAEHTLDNGHEWLTGNADPNSSVGQDGDLFLNTATGDYFRKSAGVWLFVGNLQGPEGLPGSPGQNGVGILTAVNNGNGTFTLFFSDGSQFTTSNLTGPAGDPGAPGQPGDPGAGITQITDNGDGTLTLTYGDGSMLTTSNLTGPEGPEGPAGDQGEAGVGITDITDNGDGTLTITYGDGSTLTTIDLTGPEGPAGAEGPAGDQGEAGVGITDITDNGDGTLTLTYGDGSTLTTSDLTGPVGPEGPEGAEGPEGPSGQAGQDGQDGATWLTGSGVPDPLLGAEGDFYFQSDGNYYQKQSGNWVGLGLVDTDPGDDLLDTDLASGEVTGTFDNLQIAPAAIGLSNFSDMGAVGSGAVIKWNGTNWEIGTDDGLEYGSGTGIVIAGDTISASNEDPLWNAVQLKSRPIGGMDPVDDESYFLVINGETNEYEHRKVAGDITGDFDSLSVQKLKGRPIGGMDPVDDESYFLVINGTTNEYEHRKLAGDVTGDFNQMRVDGLLGFPITGGDPNDGQTLVLNDMGGGDMEWQSADVLAIPLYSQGSQSVPMIELENTSSSSSTYGIIGTSRGRDGLFDLFDLDDPGFVYPAGVYGESNTTGIVGQAGAGVLGRAVSGGTNNGIGGWFQGNSIGAIGVGYQDGQAGILGLSGLNGMEGAIWGGLFLGAPNNDGDNAGLMAAAFGAKYGGLFYGSNNNTTPDNAALRAVANGADYAGYFNGDVNIVGQFSSSNKFFKIDHPQDPTNKYLYHSVVESSEYKNFYDGIVTTDGSGYARVQLPDYFEALNQDFRYQLTVIGTFAQAIVAEKVQNNEFVIRTDQPHVEVSWQVTGVRKDPYALAHPLVPEVEKEPANRGTYLHPEVYGRPADKAALDRDELFGKRRPIPKK